MNTTPSKNKLSKNPYTLDAFPSVEWLTQLIWISEAKYSGLILNSMREWNVYCFTPGSLNIWTMADIYYSKFWEVDDWDTRFFSKTSKNKIHTLNKEQFTLYLEINLNFPKWKRRQIIVRKIGEDQFEFYTIAKSNRKKLDDSIRQACTNWSQKVVTLFDDN